jgi:hypothetical protein
MAMGPLVRVLPSLSATQRENVRATLEVYFRGTPHHKASFCQLRSGWCERVFDAAALADLAS